MVIEIYIVKFTIIKNYYSSIFKDNKRKNKIYVELIKKHDIIQIEHNSLPIA